MDLRPFQIITIILLSLIAITKSRGGGRGGGNPPPKGGSSNKNDDKGSGWSNSVSTTQSSPYTSIPGEDYSVTDQDEYDDDDDDYNSNCWFTDSDGKRHKKKRGKKGKKWGKWRWKRKNKKKKNKDDDDDDNGYDISSTMDNDYDVTVTATTEYLDIYSTEDEDCDDDYYTQRPWVSATPYTTDNDEDNDDYTSTITPGVDEDVTTSSTSSTTSTSNTISATETTSECPDELDEDSSCECFIGIDVDTQCPDRCNIRNNKCCPPVEQINDVSTSCECFVVEGADTEIELCPSRCDDSSGACLTPQSSINNNNDQAAGFAFGSTQGTTVGGIAGLIGGVALISCCLIIIGCIYCKKRNNKYGNVARIDDLEDGRANDIGDDEGIIPTTATMAKSTKTGLDGEEMEMEEIGHATGKTQTIIQYDSSDDEDQIHGINDNHMALPEKETNGRALDSLIVDGNHNYTK